MLLKPHRESRLRHNQKGQALFLGIAILFIMCSATAATLIIMLNTSIDAFYSEKLNFVCSQCAQYAANQAPYADPTSATIQIARAMMETMHLGSGSPQVSVINNNGQSEVTISDNFSLFGKALGSSVPITASAIANNQFPTKAGNGELMVRINQSVSPKLTAGVRIFGNRTFIPLSSPAKTAKDPRYLSSHDAGTSTDPLDGDSPPSEAGAGL